MEEQQWAINRACTHLRIQPITLLKIDRFRWTLEERPNIGPEMIKLERLLQEATGKPVDLRLQPKADKNKRFDRNYLRGVEKL